MRVPILKIIVFWDILGSLEMFRKWAAFFKRRDRCFGNLEHMTLWCSVPYSKHELGFRATFGGAEFPPPYLQLYSVRQHQHGFMNRWGTPERGFS